MKKIRLKTLQGFTFVEVMVTVAIVAILAMVVYPSYLDHVRKARRVDAKVALVELAQLQEDAFITTKKYLTDNSAIKEYGGRSYDLANHGNSNYKLTVENVDGFTLIAKAIGKQEKDTDCYQFKINSLGQKTAFEKSRKKNNDCW